MSFPPPDKITEEELLAELEGVEGEPIEVEPIEIVGDVPEPEPGGWLDALRIEGAPTKDEAVDMAAEALGAPEIADALRGTAEGATFGHADELAGMGEAALGGDYAETRDRIRDEQSQAAEDSPYAFGGGALTGALATAPLLASPIIGAESMAGRLGAAAAEGVGLGAFGASGATEGAVGSDEWSGDVARGGALGGALGFAGGGLGEVAQAGGRWARQAAARQRAAAAADEGGSLLGDLVPMARPAQAAEDIAEQAARSLDDVVDRMDEGAADVSRALRRAERAARRARNGGAEVAPWAERIRAASERESGAIGTRLARLAGSGRDALKQREALRVARSGQPVNFGELESVRRQIADALIEQPTPALQGLHDDLAEALQSAAESQGMGPQYFDALQASLMAGVERARSGGGLGSRLRDAAVGAMGGAATEAAYDVAQGREVGMPSPGAMLSGAALGAVRGSPRIRGAAARTGGAILEGAAPLAEASGRVFAGQAGRAAAGLGNDPPTATDEDVAAILDDEPPTATDEDVERILSQ